MDFTPNLNLPIPNADAVPPKNISDQFPEIALALTMLDAIIHTLQGVVAGKAETDHTQAMSTITGLVDALAAKMPANQTFSLDSLTDVQGAAEALVNYVLVKNASGFWVPSTALAALGVHNHAISEVVGLAALLDDLAVSVAALSSGKANKAVTVTGAGLATGGGDLSANRVITVAKATDAEAQARSRDDVAVSPKGVGLALAAYNKWETIRSVSLAGLSALIVADLAAFRMLKISGAFKPGTNGSGLFLQLSSDNGATWKNGATDYYQNYYATTNSTGGAGGASNSAFSLLYGASSNWFGVFDRLFAEFNKVSSQINTGHMMALNAAGGSENYKVGGHRAGGAGDYAANALRFFPGSGVITDGYLQIEGVRG